jgi:hypothetical protein
MTRLRENPIQIYLSDHELRLLIRCAKRAGCNRAELVRRWIHRDQAEARTAPIPDTTTYDPRQLRILGS